MLESLFGPEIPLAVRFFIAFVVVFGLIGLAAWLVRRFGATRLTEGMRGRQPRLAVIEAGAVDGRRKLVLVRRDNVEHLLMIGGPTDIVVEPNIVRGQAAAAREVVTPRAVADTLPRAVPLGEPAAPWPQAEIPAARAPRPALAEEAGQWSLPAQPEAPRRRAPESLAGLAAELTRPTPHAEPVIGNGRHAPLQPAETPPSADQNLAEMAQRLEAALRRPGAGAPVKPEPRSAAPKPEPTAAPEQPSEPPRSGYASLEQEMASLLGRQPGKS
jgi:flagellar biogenesis protein FliO